MFSAVCHHQVKKNFFFFNFFIYFFFFNPDDGKQPKTFGLNILINFFFNLLALYIEYKM